MGRSNRQILSGGKDYATRKSKEFGVTDVEFNRDDRLEYLTGFHKRKVQRQKKAQEFQKEQERLTKIEQRKEMRDERKRQMEENMRQFREGLELDREINEEINGSDSSGEEDGGSDNRDDGKEEEAAEEWYGFDQKPILKTSYPGAEVSIETLEPSNDLDTLAQANNVKLDESDRILKQSISRAGKYAKFLGMDEKPKPKKKKFRYLTKGERKVNQLKANKGKKRK